MMEQINPNEGSDFFGRVERNERKNVVRETENLVRESVSNYSELIKSITAAYAAYI